VRSIVGFGAGTAADIVGRQAGLISGIAARYFHPYCDSGLSTE
jgi:hypothetical protein